MCPQLMPVLAISLGPQHRTQYPACAAGHPSLPHAPLLLAAGPASPICAGWQPAVAAEQAHLATLLGLLAADPPAAQASTANPQG